MVELCSYAFQASDGSYATDGCLLDAVNRHQGDDFFLPEGIIGAPGIFCS